ncbi:hypothetical protein SKAU_G00053920 [Synaphobranchus kaupii]|uniref:Uncharacterized protein n=1 Tax=Synaphobranchus kaupii TaxID=118154 RepID=A0A9Q1G3K1_SYNKA|nr:hypothetical protein SKAU_G00053920 [Synaphobranchus kaupii]
MRCPLLSRFTQRDISPRAVPSEHAWRRASPFPLPARSSAYSRPRAALTRAQLPPENNLRQRGAHPGAVSPEEPVEVKRAAQQSTPAGERYAIVPQVSLGQGDAQSSCQILCDAIKHQSSSNTGNRRAALMECLLCESLHTRGRRSQRDESSCSLGRQMKKDSAEKI